MPNRTLGDLLESRQNSFNAVRLLAAAAVFVSHSFLLLPFGAHLEPFDGATYNLGLALLAAVITVAMGWLSWTLIERPALSLKLRENILVAAN
eukprot:jgi/Tetstr1/450419/TSEL_037455.t1